MRRRNGFVIRVSPIAAVLFAISTAIAGEKTLEFQLVTKQIDPRTIEAPNVENQAITQTRAFGVGVFKDGRIAIKDFVAVYDFNKGVGSLSGYSTYTFDDGSSVTAHFTGERNANQLVHGDYKILSGTGAYAGAMGTGTFDTAPSKFKNVSFYNVKLKIVTP